MCLFRNTKLRLKKSFKNVIFNSISERLAVLELKYFPDNVKDENFFSVLYL